MLCSVTEDSSFAAAMAVSAAFSLSFSLSCAKSGAQKSIEHASAQEIAKRKTRSPETTTVSSTPRLRLIHILLRASNPKGRQAAQFYAALGCKSKLPALRRFRFYALVAPFLASRARRSRSLVYSSANVSARHSPLACTDTRERSAKIQSAPDSRSSAASVVVRTAITRVPAAFAARTPE